MTSSFLKMFMTATLLTLLSLTIPLISMAKSITGERPMNSKKVFVIHGYMAKASDHWFGWLKSKLDERGIEVEVLALPDSFSPDPIIWQKTLEENIDRLNEHTYFVAHSLGCISLLSYLEDSKPGTTIGGLILVSGFAAPLPELPQLNNFVEHQVNFETIINVSPQRAIFGSPQDSIVPYILTERLARDLNANLYSIDNAGHFLAEDGYVYFPELLETLLRMTSRK